MILAVALGLVALAALTALVVVTRRRAGLFRRIFQAAERLDEGDLSVPVPEDDPQDLAALARSVNRMRAGAARS